MKYLVGLVAGLFLGVTGVAAAAGMGAAPRDVDLTIPCQRPNQLNCSWYGQRLAARTSESPPPYTGTLWYNWAEPDGKTFCRYLLVPQRALVCADHWPLVDADY